MTKPVDPADFENAALLDEAHDPDAAPVPFEPVLDWRRIPGWTIARQKAFIATLAETGSVLRAAETAGVTPRSAYRLRLRPGAESFRKAWAQAQQIAVETLTSVAFDRAVVGTMRDVYAKGAKIGQEWVPSDRLLMFLLKHLDSTRYGNLSGLQPAAIEDPVPLAQDRLPGAIGKLVDQPIEADRDWFEQFDMFQRLPEFD